MRYSPVFRAMLVNLRSRPVHDEGLSEQRPLRLNGTSEAEFESLLAYYYEG